MERIGASCHLLSTIPPTPLALASPSPSSCCVIASSRFICYILISISLRCTGEHSHIHGLGLADDLTPKPVADGLVGQFACAPPSPPLPSPPPPPMLSVTESPRFLSYQCAFIESHLGPYSGESVRVLSRVYRAKPVSVQGAQGSGRDSADDSEWDDRRSRHSHLWSAWHRQDRPRHGYWCASSSSSSSASTYSI